MYKSLGSKRSANQMDGSNSMVLGM